MLRDLLYSIGEQVQSEIYEDSTALVEQGGKAGGWAASISSFGCVLQEKKLQLPNMLTGHTKR